MVTDNSNAMVLLAALGIVSTCVLGLIWVIKHLFQKILPVLEAMKLSLDYNSGLTKHTEEVIVAVDSHISDVNSSHKRQSEAVVESMSKVEAAVEHIPQQLKDVADQSSKEGLVAVEKIIKASKE